MRLHERAGTHSDDDDVLPFGRDEAPVPVALQLPVLGHQQALLVLRQELHREVHALERDRIKIAVIRTHIHGSDKSKSRQITQLTHNLGSRDTAVPA